MLNSGQRAKARQRFVEEAARLGQVVACARKLHARREHAFGAEAEVVALQLDEAAHQQTGAGQQDERQRHFGDDERAEHAVQSAAAGVTPAFAQRIARGARRDECGHETEEDAGQERSDHGERDHRHIERHLVEPRNRNAIAHQREQATMTQRGDGQPRDATGGRENQTFGEHLAHQPPASRAERGAHAELALACRAPREQQVRDVHAGHEQHEQHGAHQGEQRRPELPDHLFLQPKEHHGPAGVALRLLFLELGVDAPHLAVCALERDTFAQSCNRVRTAAAAHGAELLHRLTVWNEEVGLLTDEGEAGRHHADDRPGAVDGGERHVEHVPAAAKTSLPEFVAQHDDRVRRSLPRRVYARPSAGWTPSARKTSDETVSPDTSIGWPLMTMATPAGPTIPRCSSVRVRSRQATKLAGAITFRCSPPRVVSQTVTIRSGSWYGSGSSITVRTTLKIAEVAPMPRASVTSAAAVKPGARRSTRAP